LTDSGSLDYEEFIPLMVQVLQAISDMDKKKREDEQLKATAGEVADSYLRDNMTPDQLEELMRASFKEADVSGTGVLSIKEFRSFMRTTGITLSEKEINMLFMSVDVDGSGSIDMEEFYPVFHEVMRMMIQNEALAKLKAETAGSQE